MKFDSERKIKLVTAVIDALVLVGAAYLVVYGFGGKVGPMSAAGIGLFIGWLTSAVHRS